MPKPIKKITSWSFSRWLDYQLCALKAKFKILDKLKEPSSPQMARGTEIHGIAEKYIKGEIPAKMPPELKNFSELFKTLRDQFKKRLDSMCVEDQWAFDKDWNPCRWDDWDNCWVRIKLDCAYMWEDDNEDYVLDVIDWKTGQNRPEKTEEYLMQLELYALAALVLHPHIKKVRPSLKFLDGGETEPKELVIYTQADIPRLKKLWERRVKAMMNDTSFAPRPNDKCRWCHFRKANGGPCQY